MAHQTCPAPIPRATYRLQLHRGFTFEAAARIVPYLAELGVSHVYVSPILTAQPGSVHGYDVVDLERVNPELGGEEGLRRFSQALASRGLGLILDTVPNHMGVRGSHNRWWLSVLRWGRASPHAAAFDIDWERPEAPGKIILPILGDPYGDILESGAFHLSFDAESGGFALHYGEHVLPLAPTSYAAILQKPGAGAGASDVTETRLEHLAAAFASIGHDVGQGQTLMRQLAEETHASPRLAMAIDAHIAALAGTVGNPASFDALDRLIGAQHWAAYDWRFGTTEVNYRRFFDINELAGLRVENDSVFDATHALTLRLVREGHVQGLRIDHIDGLADPKSYLAKLRLAVGPACYLVVEKILGRDERLRDWPIAGTTGYDALNLIDGVLVNRDAREEIEAVYRAARGCATRFADEVAAAKTFIIERSFRGELESLVEDAKRIAAANRHTTDMTKHVIRRALIEVLTALPVYRSYLDAGPVDPLDADLIQAAIGRAKASTILGTGAVHDLIAALLLGRDAKPTATANSRETARFRRRFQQLSGPIMAKSLEDTTFYRYVPLIALNEVGGDPGEFGLAPESFHASMRERAREWPNTMLATATHDTKRGEDARARLLGLADDPAGWREAVVRFETLARPLAAKAGPDAVDRLLLLQSILGAWPPELHGEDGDARAWTDFRERMKGFATKALREAKRHSSWSSPNASYEEASLRLLEAMLSPDSPFVAEFTGFARRLAVLGHCNGLARTVLKFCLPGVPDIFQGTEFWDFALVDPDNRQPVDYGARIAGLAAALCPGDLASGRLKQRLIARMLADRKAAPLLYARGDYEEIAASGAKARHVLAFQRSDGASRLACAVARLPGSLSAGGMPVGKTWADSAVALAPGRWHDILTGREIETTPEPTRLADLFAELPAVALRRG